MIALYVIGGIFAYVSMIGIVAGLLIKNIRKGLGVIEVDDCYIAGTLWPAYLVFFLIPISISRLIASRPTKPPKPQLCNECKEKLHKGVYR